MPQLLLLRIHTHICCCINLQTITSLYSIISPLQSSISHPIVSIQFNRFIYSFFSSLRKKKFRNVLIEGIKRGVSALYCTYSFFSPCFLSFVTSNRGIPLTFKSKNVTKRGDIREMVARGRVRAGAHRP